MTIIKRLTVKEKLFCTLFAECGDVRAAAKRAGFEDFDDGLRLIGKEEIIREIEAVFKRRKRLVSAIAEAGYRRLAFGGVCDAAALLYMDSPSREKLDEMDLFMVSEIKKPKDGSMEIKFFDRLKALEKLEALSAESGDARSLFDAIGAAAGSGADD